MLDGTNLGDLQEAVAAHEEISPTVTPEKPEEIQLEGQLNVRELAAPFAPAIDARVHELLAALREGLEGPEGLELEDTEEDDVLEMDDHVDLQQLAGTMVGVLTPNKVDPEDK